MERGSAVGTAGVRTVDDKAGSDDYIGEENHRAYQSVCGRLQFASPRRPDILFTLKGVKELGRGLARPLQSHFQLMKHLM
eukprot:521642-Amphidinium_carterae.1